MGQTMAQLVGSAHQLKALVSGMAQASEQQHRNIASVDGMLRHVDGSTQQNAALVEEVSAASDSLVRQTELLGELVGQFRASQRRPEGKVGPAPTPAVVVDEAVAEAS